MKITKILLCILFAVVITGCQSSLQDHPKETSSSTKYEEVIKEATNEKEEILALIDYLNQNTTSVLRLSTDTSVDNQEMGKGQTQFWKKENQIYAFTQYKGIDADQKTLLGEKYQEIGIVNKGQFANQDTFYRTTENTNKKFFTDDFDDLTVSKQSNNDNNVVYHLESSTTYMANIEMVGVEEKPGVLVQDITVNSDAQIVSQVVMILDKETNKQPDNIYKTEYTYSQYNEDVSIDEESIHQSITSIQGKKSNEVKEFIEF